MYILFKAFQTTPCSSTIFAMFSWLWPYNSDKYTILWIKGFLSRVAGYVVPFSKSLKCIKQKVMKNKDHTNLVFLFLGLVTHIQGHVYLNGTLNLMKTFEIDDQRHELMTYLMWPKKQYLILNQWEKMLYTYIGDESKVTIHFFRYLLSAIHDFAIFRKI